MTSPSPDAPESRPRSRPTNSKLGNAIIALLPVLACFLGGATEKWAEGIILVLLGSYLLISPPRLTLGWAVNTTLFLLLGFAAVSFLPARWFYLPGWRSALTEDLGFSIPNNVSAQPWVTFGAWVSLAAGICWFYRVATLEIDLRAVRFVIRIFVSAIVCLALLSIALYWAHLSFPFWINERGFGPFPNRNQTADLFGISAIVLLACVQDDFRSGRIRWIFGVLGMAVLLAAVILNFSRAGIAILVGGSFLWVIAVALRRRSTAGIAVAVSLLLVLLAAVLLLGGKTLERFQQWGTSGPGISSDFRWKIFHDTFRLIHGSPWCGIGLGNFHGVFGMFRKESIAELTVLHPESDWLWLTSEAGWLTTALLLIAVGLLFIRIFPLQEGTNQRFRLATLIAALVFAMHGLVDVSGHRVGTAYTALFLFGLAFYRPLRFKETRVAPIFFRIAGIVLLVFGATWIAAAKTALLVPGGPGVSTAKRLATESYRARNFPETVQLMTKAIDWAPLDWELYFRRALAEIAAGRPADALSDFRRARFLEPVAYELPRDEGFAWLGSQPTLTATAWRDALRKAGRKRPEVFASMLTAATLQNPEVGKMLEQFGLNEPDLALAYLGRLNGPAFRRGIDLLLARDPNLEMLNEPQKFAIFDLWSERGDVDALAKLIGAHRDLLSYAWLGMAKYHAQRGDFHAAYDLTQRYGEAVAMPRNSGGVSLPELQNRYSGNPDNITTGFALYEAQMQASRFDDALNTARHFSERGSSPAYFHYLESQAWAAKQNWERAWAAWLAYREAAAKK